MKLMATISTSGSKLLTGEWSVILVGSMWGVLALISTPPKGVFRNHGQVLVREEDGVSAKISHTGFG